MEDAQEYEQTLDSKQQAIDPLAETQEGILFSDDMERHGNLLVSTCASFSIQNEIRFLNQSPHDTFLLYMKTFSSCMIPFDPSSILYQNAFHEKLRIFPLTSFKWSIFTVNPASIFFTWMEQGEEINSEMRGG
ncbi:hypothetical protein IMY05_016G0003700 [Salix suchowensis]|nr:hypothetical protein IMY05_016G0003700 [Salix suchowensis]